MKERIYKLREFRYEIGIIVSFCIGFFLRFYQLDRQSLWSDELYSVYASSLSNWSDFWTYLEEDPHPPLFQILLSFWIRILPKFSEYSVRLFPTIISVLNLCILWFLTKTWEKPKRFIFLFLISLSPGAIYYAQEVRSYSLLLCLSSIILVLFVNLEKGGNRRFGWIGLLIASILISYVHLFGFIFVGSLYFLFWVRFLLKKNKEVKSVFYLGLITFLAFLPFVYQLSKGTKIATASWIDPPGIVLYLAYYSLFFYTSKKFFFLTVIFPVILFMTWVVKDLRKWKRDRMEVTYSSSGTFILVAFFIVLSTSLFSLYKPIVTNRNWIVTLPLVYYFVAEHLKFSLNRWYSIVGLILLTLFSLIDFKKNFYLAFKEDWRGSAQYILRNCEPPLVVSDSYPEFLSLYLQWAGHKEFSPILAGSPFAIPQSKVCFLKRFLGGNGIGVPSDSSLTKIRETTFYGFTVEEYCRTK